MNLTAQNYVKVRVTNLALLCLSEDRRGRCQGQGLDAHKQLECVEPHNHHCSACQRQQQQQGQGVGQGTLKYACTAPLLCRAKRFITAKKSIQTGYS